MHLKNCVVASSADLVCSIHHTAVLLLQCGHGMFMVGKSCLSSSITFKDALLADTGLTSVTLLPSEALFFALNPHLGQTTSSPEGFMRAWQFGQKRKWRHLFYFSAALTMPDSSLA